MKVIVKNLQKQVFEVELSENATIGEVKVALETQHKLESASLQKLILKGKVMTDNQILLDLKLGATDFFVVMISKQKAPEPETKPMEVEKPQTIPPQTPSQQPQPQPQTQTPSQQPTETPSDSASALVTGAALEKTITQLMEISGQPKEIVQRALRAAFNNPDRAVEYLFNGIPSTAEEAGQPQQAAISQQQQQQQQRPPTTTQTQAPQTQQPQTPFFQQPAAQQPTGQQQQQQGGQSPLDALRSLPDLPQIRAMVRTNPQLLQPLLQQLHRTNPDLVQYIQQHPDEFFQLLQGEDDEEGGGHPNVIQVTPEEKEAIERLEALGFERSKVIEAFFACDKNETLAANYLFDSMNEDD